MSDRSRILLFTISLSLAHSPVCPISSRDPGLLELPRRPWRIDCRERKRPDWRRRQQHFPVLESRWWPLLEENGELEGMLVSLGEREKIPLEVVPEFGAAQAIVAGNCTRGEWE